MFIQFVVLAGALLGVWSAPSGFVVEARHIHGKESVSLKSIHVQDGVTGNLQMLEQRPFVTGLDVVRGDLASAQQPIISVLSEGVSLKVKIHDGDLREISVDTVFLDVTAEVSKVDGDEINILDDKVPVDEDGNPIPTQVQSPQVKTKQTRVLTPVKLGKPLTISIGEGSDESIELTIRR